MNRVCQFRVWERMAENPGMDELTAYRAEQQRLALLSRLPTDRAYRERIYAKW